MKKTQQEIEQALFAPFPEYDIEWRVGQSGIKKDGKPWARVLPYISARAVQERLDSVFGIDGWQCSYAAPQSGVICTISVKMADGMWIHKSDGSDLTDIEPLKGGISGALKRAASVLGIGRYLYQLESAFAIIVDQQSDKTYYSTAEDKKTGAKIPFYWLPPTLPSWALPKKP